MDSGFVTTIGKQMIYFRTEQPEYVILATRLGNDNESEGGYSMMKSCFS